MPLSLGLSVGERLSMPECIEHARLAEDMGFSAVWVAEGRLTRDAIVPAAIIASATNHIRIGTGVINSKSRNVALTAVTFKTLDEVAPERIDLGIGPWWEPLATMVGEPLRRPLAQMREYVTALRRFFNNEEVNFDGEFVQVRGARFDMMYRENVALKMPIYIGAVGPNMLELSGEISDGVLLDFNVPTTYNEWAVECVNRGIERRSDGVGQIDLPQLVTCSVDDEKPQDAIDACKGFLTMYLAQQAHISVHSGVEAELVDAIKERLTWPGTPAQVQHAMRLVSNELTQSLTACGTAEQALQQLEAYQASGSTCSVLATVGKKLQTLKSIGEANKD